MDAACRRCCGDGLCTAVLRHRAAAKKVLPGHELRGVHGFGVGRHVVSPHAAGSKLLPVVTRCDTEVPSINAGVAEGLGLVVDAVPLTDWPHTDWPRRPCGRAQRHR